MFHLFKGGHDLAGTFKSDVLGWNDYRFPALSGSLHWTPTRLRRHATPARSSTAATRSSPIRSSRSAGRAVDVALRGHATRTSTRRVHRLPATARPAVRRRRVRTQPPRMADGPVRRAPRRRIRHGGAAARRPADDGAGRRPSGADCRRAARMGTVRAGAASRAPAGRRGRRRIGSPPTSSSSSRAGSRPSARTSRFRGPPRGASESRFAFHVTSRDWQESDQVLAGLITDFGSPSDAVVAIGGRGEFDGVMTGPFRRPRVEGVFSGEDLRAWDTLWGAGSAHIVVRRRLRHGHATASCGADDSEIRADGLFSLATPRPTAARRSTRGSASRAAISTACATRFRSTSTRCRAACPASSA